MMQSIQTRLLGPDLAKKERRVTGEVIGSVVRTSGFTCNNHLCDFGQVTEIPWASVYFSIT